MRFMMLVKGAENMGAPPTGFVAAMGKSRDEAMKTGSLLDAGGLAPTAMSSRVRVSRGKVTVSDGPFTEAKEVVGGYGMIEAASKEEALEAGKWLMQMHAQHWPGWEGEVEIRQVFGPEGFRARA